jgi:hypothetical protein
VDRDYAAQNGVIVEPAQNIVVRLLEVVIYMKVLSFIVLDHPMPVHCPVQKAYAATSWVTVEQAQNIIRPSSFLIRIFDIHLRHFWEAKLESWG